ncbi:MAG: NAD(P)-dependent oxidoreductase [Solirubrobacterales bacterium]|nr:NAD(P)-dependent oxidoreductase [Solirubrobacterales bacterium]
MKVLVAGATGAIGRPLVVKLIERGHQVTGMTRSEKRRELIEWLGADSVVVDALDPEGVAGAVAETRPDVIVHELTALAGPFDLKDPEKTFGPTNRLRREGTDHLLSAARAAGVKRFVAQSFAPLIYERTGSLVKTEADPVDTHPPAAMTDVSEAMRYLERAVTSADGIEGVVLRYGGFYGEGTSMDVRPDGEQTEMIRKRRLPIVGSGGGVWSFVHVDDAAEATAIAVEKGEPGIYNIVDDQPAPVRDWLPAVAEAIGARPPRRFPRWLARLVAGEAGVMMMTEMRGSSNQKAKRELGWSPAHPAIWETLAGSEA